MAATGGPSTLVSIFVATVLLYASFGNAQNPEIEASSPADLEITTVNPIEASSSVSPSELPDTSSPLPIDETSSLVSESSIGNATGQEILAAAAQSGNESALNTNVTASSLVNDSSPADLLNSTSPVLLNESSAVSEASINTTGQDISAIGSTVALPAQSGNESFDNATSFSPSPADLLNATSPGLVNETSVVSEASLNNATGQEILAVGSTEATLAQLVNESLGNETSPDLLNTTSPILLNETSEASINTTGQNISTIESMEPVPSESDIGSLDNETSPSPSPAELLNTTSSGLLNETSVVSEASLGNTTGQNISAIESIEPMPSESGIGPFDNETSSSPSPAELLNATSAGLLNETTLVSEASFDNATGQELLAVGSTEMGPAQIGNESLGNETSPILSPADLLNTTSAILNETSVSEASMSNTTGQDILEIGSTEAEPTQSGIESFDNETSSSPSPAELLNTTSAGLLNETTLVSEASLNATGPEALAVEPTEASLAQPVNESLGNETSPELLNTTSPILQNETSVVSEASLSNTTEQEILAVGSTETGPAQTGNESMGNETSPVLSPADLLNTTSSILNETSVVSEASISNTTGQNISAIESIEPEPTQSGIGSFDNDTSSSPSPAELLNATSAGLLNETTLVSEASFDNATGQELLAVGSTEPEPTQIGNESLGNETSVTLSPAELLNATMAILPNETTLAMESSTVNATGQEISTAEPTEAELLGNETLPGASPAALFIATSPILTNATSLVSESSIEADNRTGQEMTPTQSGNGSSILSDFDCWNFETGYYGNPDVACDTKFYVCVDREMFAYEFRCPAKLYFDPETKLCDMWAHIPACSGNPRPSTTAVNQTEVTLSPVPPVIDCHDKPDGNYPDPVSTPKVNCSNRYFTCVGKRQMVSKCPRGLYFDQERNECDLYDRVFTCSGKLISNESLYMGATFAPVNFSCDGKPDGFYVEKCDNIFYSCTVGQVFQFECPSDLVFDTEWLSCESPSDTFICTGTRRPATAPHSSTARVIPVSTTPSPMNCTSRPDGTYRDPSTKCSRVFYHCAHDFTIENVCPGNLYFDDSFKRCDLWINVFDCSGVRPTAATRRITVATSPVSAVDFDCHKMEDGNYPNPKDKCSQFYYVCANMEGYLQNCPAGLFYDPELNTCDKWIGIPACSGASRKPTEASLNFTTESFTTEKPEFDCIDQLDGAYVTASNNCSGYYFRCVAGMTFKFHCPGGLFYDLDADRCDLYDNVFACSGHTRPSTTPSTSTSQGTTQIPPIDCTLLDDGDYPDAGAKNECSHYFYTCAAGEAIRRECPARTFYDGELKLCSSYWNVPACSGQPRENTTSPSPRPVNTGSPPPFDCTKLYDGNYPSGNCSEDYYSCVGGLTFARKCPVGSVYDEEFDDCEFPFMVPNCGGNRITEGTTKVMETVTPVGGFDCKFLQEGNYADPNASDGCSSIYYTCANGITSRSHCPNGLYFDVVAQQCNSRNHVPACGGTRANVTQPELQSITLPSNSSLESTGLTSESAVNESSTAPSGISGNEISTEESLSNASLSNLDNTSTSASAETGSPSPAFLLINETAPSAEATPAFIQNASVTLASSENASEIVMTQENVTGLIENGTSTLPTEIFNVSQAGLENATIAQRISSTNQSSENATGAGELVSPSEISNVTAVSLENATLVSNESSSGNGSEAGLLSTANASEISSTVSPLPAELLNLASEQPANASSNVSAVDLSNVTFAVLFNESSTDLTQSQSPADLLNTTSGTISEIGEPSTAMFIDESALTSSPASELLENATGSEIVNASLKSTELANTTAENVTVAALEVANITSETGESGLVNATDAGLVNATDAGLVNATDAGLVNATDAGLVNATDAGLVNATDAGLVNATDAGLVNATDAGLVNATDAGLVNATDTTAENVTVVALEISNITAETGESGLVNATEVGLENATRVPSNESGSETELLSTENVGEFKSTLIPVPAELQNSTSELPVNASSNVSAADLLNATSAVPINESSANLTQSPSLVELLNTTGGNISAIEASTVAFINETSPQSNVSELTSTVSAINATQPENVNASSLVNETSSVSEPSPASILESSIGPNVTVAVQDISNMNQSSLENATVADLISLTNQSSENATNAGDLINATEISNITQASLEISTQTPSNASGAELPENANASSMDNETSTVPMVSPASLNESSSVGSVTLASQEISNISQSGLENATTADLISFTNQSSENATNAGELINVSQANLENTTLPNATNVTQVLATSTVQGSPAGLVAGNTSTISNISASSVTGSNANRGFSSTAKSNVNSALGNRPDINF